MAINIDYGKSGETIFHLQTNFVSYIMAVRQESFLSHIYWGKKIHTPDIDNAGLLRAAAFDPLVSDKAEFSLDYVRQEYPVGDVDYRNPAICVKFADGSRVCPLRYESYNIKKGKPPITGLPSVYTESDDEADTLEICLSDSYSGLRVYLIYSVLQEFNAITRSVRIVNDGEDTVCLKKALSASVDFETKNFRFLTLPGAWGRERHIECLPLRYGTQSIGSRRGASSHQMNPFFALLEGNADEENGGVYGFNFVYSGSYSAGVEVDQLGQSRAYMGLPEENFLWKLGCGESFETPEVVMVYSDKGLGGMSRIYHRLYRKRLVRGKYRDMVRPILANNWEATYFDFDEEKIVALAKEAGKLGIELLVLDDGWFGKRDDDTSSLGDWFVNIKKLPSGLGGLGKRVNDAGVKFGLWFEPEMVSVDSELYRNHPEWCIHSGRRERTECRHQLTLDFSRQDVCEYIFETLDKILSDAPISYVKWDMNRHMSNMGSEALPADRQMELAHRYMLGLYSVLDKITTKHPEVLFESCSGGGGRFDAGMLYYMPQTWTSDDTDPVERLFIQYGTSIVYPISSMGAHVSAVPNHQSGRVTSLKMRGDVAMSGNFGYELDVTKFNDDEKKEVQEQIKRYKELRGFLQSGDFYRLLSPFGGNNAAWEIVSEDGSQVFAAYFRIQSQVNPGISRMRFAGLEPEGKYRDRDTGDVFFGDELMQIGIVVDFFGDYQSKTWWLVRE